MSGIRKRWWDDKEEIEDDGTRWWHNLPQCNVGDLVRYKSTSRGKHARKGRDPWLVIEVKPEKPCRVNPSQIVTVFDSISGRSSSFDAKNLEVISESG